MEKENESLEENAHKQHIDEVTRFNTFIDDIPKDFLLSFDLMCSKLINTYYYPCACNGYKTERDVIISNFRKKHKRPKNEEEAIIKALEEEAERRLSVLPNILRDPVLRFVNHRVKGAIESIITNEICATYNPHLDNDTASSQTEKDNMTPTSKCIESSNNSWITLAYWSFYSLHDIAKYLGSIASYYVVACDLKSRVTFRTISKRYRAIDLFLPDTSYRTVAVWKKLITLHVDKINYQDEWFAFYYVLYPILKTSTMNKFASLMNKWFPQTHAHCSADSLKHYSYLLNHDVKEWMNVHMPNNPATKVAIVRIRAFLLDSHLLELPIYKNSK